MCTYTCMVYQIKDCPFSQVRKLCGAHMGIGDIYMHFVKLCFPISFYYVFSIKGARSNGSIMEKLHTQWHIEEYKLLGDVMMMMRDIESCVH